GLNLWYHVRPVHCRLLYPQVPLLMPFSTTYTASRPLSLCQRTPAVTDGWAPGFLSIVFPGNTGLGNGLGTVSPTCHGIASVPTVRPNCRNQFLLSARVPIRPVLV